jgi:hypothetical protein
MVVSKGYDTKKDYPRLPMNCYDLLDSSFIGSLTQEKTVGRRSVAEKIDAYAKIVKHLLGFVCVCVFTLSAFLGIYGYMRDIFQKWFPDLLSVLFI